MPYNSVKALPEHVKKYSPTIQRQWMNVFNSVYGKVLKETKKISSAEKRAFMAANSVLKKRFNKEQLANDYFAYLTDIFLNNLEG